MKRRILIFSAGTTEPGGAARRALLLSRGLRDRGWDVRVVTRAGTLRRFQRLREPGLTIVEVPGFDRPRLGVALFLATAIPLGLMWGLRARVALSMQLLSQTTAAALVGFVLRKPFLAMSTTSGSLNELDHVRASRFLKLRRRLISSAATLIAQTEVGAAELAGFFPGSEVKVLPNPVGPVKPAPLRGGKKAVFTGRLSEEKDLSLLLDVWREMAAEGDDATLTLVGTGGSYRSVEPLLRETVQNDPLLTRTVTFTGWVDDVDTHLRDGDVFVLPSRSEGMSNALLEACAYGRVVVASDIPANVALLGPEYPLLFEVGNAISLRNVLEKAFQDEVVRKLAVDRALEVAAGQSTDRVIARLEGLVEAATSRGRNRKG